MHRRRDCCRSEGGGGLDSGGGVVEEVYCWCCDLVKGSAFIEGGVIVTAGARVAGGKTVRYIKVQYTYTYM